MIALSRLYLGRHFLADVLGGLAAGAAAAGAAVLLMRMTQAGGVRAGRAWFFAAMVPIALCGLSLMVAPFDPYQAGSVAGALACIGWFEWRGWPLDAAPPARRALRVVAAVAFVTGTGWLLGQLHELGDWPDGHGVGYLFAALGFPASILGAVWLAQALGLYRPAPAPDPARR